MLEKSFSFGIEQINKVFPFHILLDGSAIIRSIGSSLRKIIKSQEGDYFFDEFTLSQPTIDAPQFESLQQLTRQLVILNHAHNADIILRGEFEYIHEQKTLLFVGSPQFNSVDEVMAQQLTLSDFAIHDPMIDLLHAKQAQETANEDLKKLLKTVNQQKADLQQLSLVASLNENGVLLTEKDGVVIWANEGFRKLTRYTDVDAIGKTPIALFNGPLTDKETVKEMLTSFYEGKSFQFELIHYRKDGSWFWGRTKGQPVLDTNGVVKQYFAIIEDITEEKKSRQRIKDFESRFRLALEKIGDNVWEHNFATNITSFSQTNIDMIGYSVDKHNANQNLWWSSIHPEDLHLLENNDRLYKSGSIDHHMLEYRMIHKNGSIQWVLDRGVVIDKTIAGAPLLIIGTHTDITERKKTEELLKINEEKYRSIIANMNLGLLEVDNNNIIQFANHSFCKMSGYQYDELIGKNAAGLFLKNDFLDILEEKNELRKTGISDAYELKAYTKKGDAVWWLISGAPRYNDQGITVGSIGIHLDISKQKEIEVALKNASQQAENAGQAKQDFLANMSHEIRTPMNAILAMSHQLEKTSLDSKQHFYLNTITAAADNLLIIINDILDISKIEAGKLSLESIGLNIRSTIQHAISVMLHKAEEKGLHLQTHIDSHIAEVLIGDPYRLNQILLNLIGNAIKFTEKGQVVLDCRVSESTDTMQTISFSVKDEGIGMSQSFLNQLFDNFSQEDISISRKYGGTGLGMSITRELVELMNGKISAASEKNLGTTITFEIPFTIGMQADMPVSEDTIADLTTLKGKRILLAEDNEMNRLVVNTVLEHYHLSVKECYNGEDVIIELRKNKYDLILMDVQMPIMDGLEATRIIRERIDTHIPIIALTANAFKGENQKCFDAGMNDFISKPFKEHTLISVISKWLGQQKKEPPVTDISHTVDHIPSSLLYDISNLTIISSGDDAFVRSMLSLFAEQTPLLVEEMLQSYLKKDYAKMGGIAHQIKPSIDNLKIGTLYSTIREIESAGKTNTPFPQLLDMIRHLDTVIHEVVNSIRKDHLS